MKPMAMASRPSMVRFPFRRDAEGGADGKKGDRIGLAH
jgi:hypothetical protein